MSREGHSVSVLYTLRTATGPYCAVDTFADWQRVYSEGWGIDLVAIPDPQSFNIAAPPPLPVAYSVHQWLKERSFDLVIFCDSSGPGYFCTQAKRCGTHYEQTTLAVNAHGISRWVRSLDETCCDNPALLAMEHIEETAIAFCDVLITPSQYMLDWIDSNLCFLPPERRTIPNILPEHVQEISADVSLNVQPCDEVVFFGRLEIRKGIEIFCDAIELLLSNGGFPHVPRVTFLGRCARIGMEHAAAYLLRRTYNWPVELGFEIAADQGQALAYLKGGNRLAVMPSIADNHPSVVLECLANKIPFLAGNVGGAVEMVVESDRDHVLVPPTSDHLAKALKHVLKNGAPVARSKDVHEHCQNSWRRFITEVAEDRFQIRRAPMTAAQVPRSKGWTTFPLNDGRCADIFIEESAHCTAEGLLALASGLSTTPIVVSNWKSGEIIHVPILDPASLLNNVPDVPVCAVESSFVSDDDRKLGSSALCRRLILAGSPVLIVPEPFCQKSRGWEKPRLTDRASIQLRGRSLEDAWSLRLGKNFAEQQAKLLEGLYDSIPCGDTLLDLNSIDHFTDSRTTIALMAGFLNGVGRRREALALLDSWTRQIRRDRSPECEPIRIIRLVEKGLFTLKNVLIEGGFNRMGEDTFLLHPNQPAEPDACCIFRLNLFEHRALDGLLTVANPQSAPVEFGICLTQDGAILGEVSPLVEPDVPSSLSIKFDPTIGPVELCLSTRMAPDAAQNHHAWALWKNLTFTVS